MARRRMGWLLAWLAAGAPVARAAPAVEEYALKAAFVCKFPLYVEWPPEALPADAAALVIGVLGSEAAFEALTRAAAGLEAQGRPLQVRRWHRGEPVQDIQLLYLALQSGETAGAHGVLTITESPSWTPAMSVVNFVVVDNRVRFDVSLKAAEAAGLKISARLLGVARKVVP